MPSKNSIKTYVANGYYHIYNRGVEKRNIFLDSRDYAVFINYLNDYLAPKEESTILKKVADPTISGKERFLLNRQLEMPNYNSKISLLAYCLMPNHFHFFLKQTTQKAIQKFMSSLCTRYVMYFNQVYQRQGTLFQGVYKAVMVTDEPQYLHITRYIHHQAAIAANQPSSYPEYLGQRNTTWIHPEEVLSFFSNDQPSLSYSSFVEEYIPHPDDL